MKPVLTYTVAPRIPESFTKLRDIAGNFWWTWSHEAKSMFEYIDPEIWQRSQHNPLRLLKETDHDRLEALSTDTEFRATLDRVYHTFTTYMASEKPVNPGQEASDLPAGSIAYFCAEFGITECFQNYSGGLGVLAGDHLKTASDLSVPLVGVGLLYKQGYFHQYLSENGWQSERYADVDFSLLPLELMLDDTGAPLQIEVPMPDGTVYAYVWRARVGRVDLILLDTNIPPNEAFPQYRDITDQLYGGTTETRIMQEMVLGIGGMRALRKAGYQPTVLHMNEGHAAFCALERTRMHSEEYGCSFAQALEITRAGGCFTTHTPVPAGNEIFTLDLMRRFFARYVSQLGISMNDLLAMGQTQGAGEEDGFSMTVLGLRTSTYRNGVSALHGEVAREMWRELWSNSLVSEVPIRGLTNGVHVPTWVAKEMADLYSRYIDKDWFQRSGETDMWSSVHEIPDAELWKVHEGRRRVMVQRIRDSIRRKEPQHIAESERHTTHELLHPHALTIGFARRFATYKRSDLLFRNMDRLIRILQHPERPVQIVIAGKAHPRDTAGKEMMHRIISSLQHHGLERRVVFVEDYDMDIAKVLVKGVDVWLNTPRRPYEASGTSGMKAALNGVLHWSILDGWWAEGFAGNNGFAIGRGEDYADPDEQDMVESDQVYRMLESIIAPMFYERDDAGVPTSWVSMMKHSIATNAGRFSSHRMVREYMNDCYEPASQLASRLCEDDTSAAIALHSWKSALPASWSDVRLDGLHVMNDAEIHVGKRIRVRVSIGSSNMPLDHVRVELCHGLLDAKGLMTAPSYHTMRIVEQKDSYHAVLECEYECTQSGSQGVAVRAMPSHPYVPFAHDLQLMRFAENEH